MYEYQSRIRYSESNIEGRLKLEALLDYFQDCSTFQSEDLELGVAYLKEHHMVWVLSSWQIVVNRYPCLAETVTVGTMPYEFKGFLGFRNFLMKDSAGERLACANTLWTLLNTDTWKPVRPTEEMLRRYVAEPKLDMEYAPRKIEVPADMQEREAVMIRPHHLDTNHHVNNGQYVKIALDVLEEDIKVRQLRVEYKKQAFLNDLLTPYVFTERGRYLVVLKDRDMDVCCIMEFIKEDKEK